VEQGQGKNLKDKFITNFSSGAAAAEADYGVDQAFACLHV
jgi:hypothetical protein